MKYIKSFLITTSFLVFLNSYADDDEMILSCISTSGEKTIYKIDKEKLNAEKIYPEDIKGTLKINDSMYQILIEKENYKENISINRYDATMVKKVNINITQKDKDELLTSFFSQNATSTSYGKCKKIKAKQII